MEITLEQLASVLAATTKYATLTEFHSSIDNKSYKKGSFWETVLFQIFPQQKNSRTIAIRRKKIYDLFRNNWKDKTFIEYYDAYFRQSTCAKEINGKSCDDLNEDDVSENSCRSPWRSNSPLVESCSSNDE